MDFLGETLRVLMDAIMDAEVSARIGADHGERSPDRLTHRNGYRSRWMGFDTSDGRTAAATELRVLQNLYPTPRAEPPRQGLRFRHGVGQFRVVRGFSGITLPRLRAQRVGPVPVRAHSARRGAENQDQDATPQGDDEKEYRYQEGN